MNLGEVVGRGKSATVYRWGSSEVVKLFRADVSRDRIDHEAKVAASAHGQRIPTAAVSGTVEIDDQKGIVFEFLEGPGLDAYLLRRPWAIRRLLLEFARLHDKIHQCTGQDLPEQRASLKRMIYEAAGLTPTAKAEDADLIDALPAGSTLCHNDYHPGNVIVTRDGLKVIDWFQATRGHLVIDIASTAFKLRRAIGFEGRNQWKALVLKSTGNFLAARYLSGYPQSEFWDTKSVDELMPLLKRAYRRDYKLSRPETRQILEEKLQDGGLESAVTWLRAMEDEGAIGSEALNGIAFSSLRRDYPREAIRYGEEALRISGGDSAIARELEAVRSRINTGPKNQTTE